MIPSVPLLGLARGAVFERVGAGGPRGVELGLLLDELVGVRDEDIGAVVRLVAAPGRLVLAGEK